MHKRIKLMKKKLNKCIIVYLNKWINPDYKKLKQIDINKEYFDYDKIFFKNYFIFHNAKQIKKYFIRYYVIKYKSIDTGYNNIVKIKKNTFFANSNETIMIMEKCHECHKELIQKDKIKKKINEKK